MHLEGQKKKKKKKNSRNMLAALNGAIETSFQSSTSNAVTLVK